MDELLYSKFKQNALFQGIEDTDVRALFTSGRNVMIQQGEYLIREGAPAKEIFFLLAGSLEVAKHDSLSGQTQVVATFGPGDVVGEIALLDKGFRSANVIASTDARLVAIPFSAWDLDKGNQAPLYKIIVRMAQNVALRLRQTSDNALRKQVDEYKKQLLFSSFFVLTISLICVFNYAMDLMRRLAALQEYSTYVTFPLTLIVLLAVVYVVKKYHLPWQLFGVTLVNWKRAMCEGFVFTLPLVGAIVMFKWALIHFGLTPQNPLLPLSVSRRWWEVLIVYSLIIVPMQELVARGCLQGLLVQFLTGEHKKWMAISVSSLAFGTAHLFLSSTVAFGVLIFSMYFGWLYARHKTLVGAWVAHALVGIVGLDIMGF